MVSFNVNLTQTRIFWEESIDEELSVLVDRGRPSPLWVESFLRQGIPKDLWGKWFNWVPADKPMGMIHSFSLWSRLGTWPAPSSPFSSDFHTWMDVTTDRVAWEIRIYLEIVNVKIIPRINSTRKIGPSLKKGHINLFSSGNHRNGPSWFSLHCWLLSVNPSSAEVCKVEQTWLSLSASQHVWLFLVPIND